MRSVYLAVLGALLGFTATMLAVGTVVLLGTGIGGGILVRERPWTARILSYDPSDVVLRSALTGCAALLVGGVYIAVLRRLRRNERANR